MVFKTSCPTLGVATLKRKHLGTQEFVFIEKWLQVSEPIFFLVQSVSSFFVPFLDSKSLWFQTTTSSISSYKNDSLD